MAERKVIGFIRTKDGAEQPVYHDEDIQQKLPNRRVVALKGTRIEGTEYPGPDLPVFEETEPPASGN
jgi:hypothetical protein